MDDDASGTSERVWREIALAPLPSLAPELADRLLAELSRHVEVPCRRVAAPAGPPPVQVPGRPQLDADRLLERVEGVAAPDSPLVAVTDQDLGLPLFTHVFGRARLGGAGAVVSVARLRPEFYGSAPDPGLLARRATAEILHELGHLAGLAHCVNRSCLMSFAASVEAVDLRGLEFCGDCAAALPGHFARGPSPLSAAEL